MNKSWRFDTKFLQEILRVKVKLIKRKNTVTIVDPIVAKYGIKKFFKLSPINPAELWG